MREEESRSHLAIAHAYKLARIAEWIVHLVRGRELEMQRPLDSRERLLPVCGGRESLHSAAD